LFTGIFFVGGALGSAIAGLAWARAGWNGVCLEALMFAGAAVIYGMRRDHTYAPVVTEEV
jgi:hypothetical protein